jgi:hypothetical protein
MFALPEARALEVRAGPADNVVLAGLTGLVIALGVYPAPLIRLLHVASRAFLSG